MTEERNQRKVYQGRVASDKADETTTVAAEIKKNHLICGKCMEYSRKYKAHGENNTAKVGDIVKTMETRPLLATERLHLLEVIEEAVII